MKTGTRKDMDSKDISAWIYFPTVNLLLREKKKRNKQRRTRTHMHLHTDI